MGPFGGIRRHLACEPDPPPTSNYMLGVGVWTQDSSHLLLPMVYSQVLLLHELEEENRAVGVDLCIGLANRPGPGLEVAKTPGGVYL